MIPEKISIFVLLVLLTICNSESANHLHPGFDGNCVCFKSSGPLDIKVPDMIQPNQGLERLVLFLYRDVITNQINMHTPSIETQKHIPDLPFGENDELTPIFDETISAIVNRSPHKIYIQASRHEPKGGLITDFDFNSDIEFLDNYNEFKDNHLSNYINVNQNVENQHRNIPTIETQENNDKWQHNVPSNYIIANQIDEQRHRHIPATEPQENSDKWRHNIPSNYINANQIDDKERHEHFTPDIESQEKNYRWKYSIPSHQIDVQRHKDVIPDIMYQGRNKWEFNVPSKYINLNQNNDQQHRDSIILPQSQAIPADLQVFPKYPQMISNNQQVISKHAPVISAHPWQLQGKFGEWILEQIETIINHKHRDKININLSTIGNSILRILYKNGMYVTDKGVLMDFYGTVLDIHTLTLRPIFVANTVPLDNLLKRPGELLSSQGALPYIQAILLTTTQLPLKVLGVVPLGKANLPVSTLSTLTSIWKEKPKNVDTKKSYVQIPNIQSIPLNFEVENIGENNSKVVNNSGKGNAIQGIDSRYNKNNNREQKDDQEEYGTRDERYKPVHTSNYINVSGNENSTSDLDQYLNLLSSLRGIKLEKDPIDSPFSKSTKIDLSLLDQAKSKSKIGSFFLPNIAISDYPLDISSKSQIKTSDIFSNRHRNPASIHIPGLMSDPLEIVFRSEHEPVTNGIGRHNHNAKETPNLISLQINVDPISSVVSKDSNPMEILKKLSLINMPSKIDVPKPLDSSSIKTITSMMPPEENWINDPMVHNFVKKQGNSKFRIENLPGLVNPAQQDFVFRSGITVPDEVWKSDSNNDEQVSTPIVGSSDDDNDNDEDDDNDDDDDDDDDYINFKIIGGNAATGSGTPLNNRGRSGFVTRI